MSNNKNKNNQNLDPIDSNILFKQMRQTDAIELNSPDQQDNIEQQAKRHIAHLGKKDQEFLKKNRNKLKILTINKGSDQGTFEFAEKTPNTRLFKTSVKAEGSRLRFNQAWGGKSKDYKSGQDDTDDAADGASKNFLHPTSRFGHSGSRKQHSVLKSDRSMHTRYEERDGTASLVAGNLRLYKVRTQDYFKRVKSHITGRLNKNERQKFFGNANDHASIQSKISNPLNFSNNKSAKQGRDRSTGKKRKRDYALKKKNTVNSKHKKRRRKVLPPRGSSKSLPTTSKNNLASFSKTNHEYLDHYDLTEYLRGCFVLVDDLRKMNIGVLNSGRFDAFDNQIIRGEKNHRVGFKTKCTQVMVENWKVINKTLNIDPKKGKTGCGVKCDIF